MFFGPIGKTRRPPWSLIGRDIFNFSSESAERNSAKVDRKQDLTVLYQFCVFLADWKNKMAALASDWLRHFLQEERSHRLLPSLCFSCWSEETRWPPWPLIGWDIFDPFSETDERNSRKLDRKQDLNFLYQVYVFRDDRLLLWNRWTQLKKTWQEARSQRPLSSLYF